MSKKDSFIQSINNGYAFSGLYFTIGTSILDGEVVEQNKVNIPLKTMNRHGLIAGATGTGKTKTLQNIAENLSVAGVPVLLMDIKGDLSGISQPGTINPKIEERHLKIGTPWQPKSLPCELLSISNEKGVRLRATVSEFGPVLLSKILELNDTQAGVLSLLFKYCDDKKLPLLDLKDLRKVLQFASEEGKDEFSRDYGLISPASAGAIMRQMVTIEQQGADKFFGEISFDVDDLIRKDKNGNGYINILRLSDIQDKPRLFSTFMLCLLAEIYASFPEKGDADKPELCLFIDEAHLIFQEASKALLEQITTIVKLIRSKGVGVFFITQQPDDIPDSVLGQLGLKVQHALRAFTEKDRKSIKTASENFPITEYYKTSELLTQMGIGEALITVLNEKGIPTPLVHTLLTAPSTRMDVISESEKEALINNSDIADKYNKELDSESAFEILNKKLNDISEQENVEEKEETRKPKENEGPSVLETIGKSQITKTVVREVTRGLLGVLGISSTRKRTTKRGGGGLLSNLFG